MRFAYPVVLEEDRDEQKDYSFLVTFPDLPEAITSGKDRAEALANASDCLEEALAYRICSQLDIPEPSPALGRPTVAPGSLIAAKAALYQELRASGVDPAELARRMGVDPAVVTNRLLNPRHASKPDQFDAAFRALGKRLVLAVENAA